MSEVRRFDVNYGLREEDSDWPFKDMLRDANIEQGDEIEVCVEDGYVRIDRIQSEGVPEGVLSGIEDIEEGRTMDGDDLDNALSWMGDEDE